MHISGSTRVFLVIGDPVAQVQAPAMFNRVFQRHGVNAVLVPVQVSADRVPAFAREVLATGNIGGLWLTIPHKTLLVPQLGHIDRCGAVAQSVNAVCRHEDGQLQGAMFDGLGLVKALRHLGQPPEGRRVLLLGAGGAGSAIAAALLDHGVSQLALHDLGTRAQQLATRLADPRVVVTSNHPAGHDLIVHATPLGLQPDDPLPLDVSLIEPGTCVVDILMKHRPTPLLQACAARGIEAHPGFEMLVQQVPDYLRFFDMPDVADAVAADLADVRASTLVHP